MMLTILISVMFLPCLGSGKQWNNSTIMFDLWCRKNWWINLLMLHNFVDHENICLSHSWYSAVDMQLFLFSLPLMYLLNSTSNKRCHNLGLGITALSIIISQTLVAVITILLNLPPVPLVEPVNHSVWTVYYKYIYIKPYCRAGPYLMGLLFGQLLIRSKLPKTLTKVIERLVVRNHF